MNHVSGGYMYRHELSHYMPFRFANDIITIAATYLSIFILEQNPTHPDSFPRELVCVMILSPTRNCGISTVGWCIEQKTIISVLQTLSM